MQRSSPDLSCWLSAAQSELISATAALLTLSTTRSMIDPDPRLPCIVLRRIVAPELRVDSDGSVHSGG